MLTYCLAICTRAHFSYSYLFSQAWTLAAERPACAQDCAANTFVLIASSVAVFTGERALRKGQQWRLSGWMLVAIVLGAIFVGLQVLEWMNKPFNVRSHAFGSLYYIITGFHMAHVAVGLVMLIAVLIWVWRREFAPGRHITVTITAYYWHFVDVVWISVFFNFYLWPLLS
ncbi:MAG: cytochrome c oxidase subunit 3 [Gammaproteobacteria bacterium]